MRHIICILHKHKFRLYYLICRETEIMDPGVLIGIIIGGGLILVSIVFEGGASSILGFLNMPAIMITVGGTLAATIIRFPIPMVIGAIAVVKKSVFVKLGSAEE